MRSWSSCNDIKKPPMGAVIRWQSTENAVPELLRKGLPAWSHFRSRDEKLLSFWSTNSRYPRGRAGWSTSAAVRDKPTVSLHHGGPIPAYDQAESLWMPTTTACDAGSPI